MFFKIRVYAILEFPQIHWQSIFQIPTFLLVRQARMRSRLYVWEKLPHRVQKLRNEGVFRPDPIVRVFFSFLLYVILCVFAPLYSQVYKSVCLFFTGS